MPDIETVITHLQIIHTWAEFARERDLQFFTAKHLEDIAKWSDDAIELLKDQDDLGTELTNACELIHKKNERIEKLLKEQEAVSITTDYFDGFGNRTSHCPSCNSRLVWHQNKNYCGECGQAVKWE